MTTNTIITGDALEMLRTLPDESVHCVVTSPPYWGLRDYGTAIWDGGDAECDHQISPVRASIKSTLHNGQGVHDGEKIRNDGVPYRTICGKCGAHRIDHQLGLEETPEEYLAKIVEVFREVRRVLRGDGCCFVNLGDSYFSSSASMNPNPSPASEHAPACGSDGTGLGDSRETDCPCPDPCDESPGDSRCHDTAHTHHAPPQSAPLRATTGHDTEPQDSIGRRSSLPDVPASTTRASFRRDRAACAPVARASASPGVPRSSSAGVPASSHSSCLNTTMFSHKLKPKDLCMMPARLAIALQADGWWLRQDIIWAKPNPMPESVTDRCTKSHEYVFLLTKSARYFYDADAVREEASMSVDDFHPATGQNNMDGSALRNDKSRHGGGQLGKPGERNRRSVWTIPTQPFPEAHFATFPEALVEPCIKAGCPHKVCAVCGAPWIRVVETEYINKTNNNSDIRKEQAGKDAMYILHERCEAKRKTAGWSPTCICDADTTTGVCLDPFMGSGTVALVATKLNRRYLGIELSPEYAEMARRRLAEEIPLFAGGNQCP